VCCVAPLATPSSELPESLVSMPLDKPCVSLAFTRWLSDGTTTEYWDDFEAHITARQFLMYNSGAQCLADVTPELPREPRYISKYHKNAKYGLHLSYCTNLASNGFKSTAVVQKYCAPLMYSPL